MHVFTGQKEGKVGGYVLPSSLSFLLVYSLMWDKEADLLLIDWNEFIRPEGT